jgi:hypothetical protein
LGETEVGLDTFLSYGVVSVVGCDTRFLAFIAVDAAEATDLAVRSTEGSGSTDAAHSAFATHAGSTASAAHSSGAA